MLPITTFYLSRVLGKKVVLDSGDTGKLLDFLVSVNAESGKPQVIAAVLHIGGKTGIYDFSGFRIREKKGQYFFTCGRLTPTDTGKKENYFYLKKNVLDRQLVDINGRKLVRVNDLRLAVMHTGTFVVAVDVGVEGLLRRLGVAKPLKRLLEPINVTIPNTLILWDEVETIDIGNEGIKLSKTYSKLTKLHVSDLADIIEDMDNRMQAEVFSSLTEDRAADVLEELETDAQINVIERMTVEKAADVLEKMPADEVADILEEISDEKAEQLLSEMESETSEEVRDLMRYDEDEVGSLMATDFVSFNQEMTVEQTFEELRRLKPESDTIYYLYVVDKNEKLIATVSLRDLVVSELTTKLVDVMNQKVIYVHDTDDIDSIAEIISKYSLLAVPVVDNNMKLMGIVIIDDIVYTLLKSRRRRGI